MSTLTELWNRKLMSFQRDVWVDGQPKDPHKTLKTDLNAS